MTTRLGIETLTLLGMPPVDHVQLVAAISAEPDLPLELSQRLARWA